jgi:ABC-type bacteriocin/lantibiotic exporter with double-glycine peptidase domain
MKLVEQLDNDGCGLACVAMIVGTSYSTIKKAADTILNTPEHRRHPSYLGTSAKHLNALLNSYGMWCSKRRIQVDNSDLLPDDCILAVRTPYIKNKKDWHWVIFKRRNGNYKIYDPGYNKIFYNFDKYNLKMHYLNYGKIKD